MQLNNVKNLQNLPGILWRITGVHFRKVILKLNNRKRKLTSEYKVSSYIKHRCSNMLRKKKKKITICSIRTFCLYSYVHYLTSKIFFPFFRDQFKISYKTLIVIKIKNIYTYIKSKLPIQLNAGYQINYTE